MEEQNLKRAETLYNKSILINGYPRQDGTNWDSLSSKMKTQGTSVFKRWYVMIVSFLFVFLSDPSSIICNACQLLNDSLTDSLLFSELDWCDPGVWRCQLKTCWGCYWVDDSDEDRVGNSCCRFGSWSLVIKLNFCSDFEYKVLSIFLSDPSPIIGYACH